MILFWNMCIGLEFWNLFYNCILDSTLIQHLNPEKIKQKTLNSDNSNKK